jgi:signal transduction histidine kinase
MTLAAFIRDHHAAIIGAFEVFAGTMMPSASHMNSVELRDHAAEMLSACAEDMDRPQGRVEQARKSEGEGRERAMRPSAHLHADARLRHGFTPGQAIAEFRALRASVLKLYEDSGGTDIAGVRRFNEAIDELLTESITRYTDQSNVFRDQFTGVLGHDLRDPLNAITMSASILECRPGAEESARAGAMIARSAARMGRLIDDLLDLTWARHGGSIPLRRTGMDLGQMCEDTIAEIRSARPDAAVEFVSRGDLRGDWDSDRLVQILCNLVGNAAQHGSGGAVRVEANGEDADVVLSVYNDGPPIPSEYHEAIFDPFVRHTPDADAPSGTGLGLFIARAIALSHAGHIGVNSSQGEGTTFTVRLPRQAPEVAVSIPRGPAAR